MRTHLYHTLGVILMITCSVSLKAQNLETEIAWPDSPNSQPVLVNSTWHVIQGTTTTITLHATIPASTDEKRYEADVTYMKGNTILEGNADTFTPQSEVISYTATFKYKTYTYDTESSSWVTDGIIKEEKSKEKTYTFHTYSKPTISAMSVAADFAYTYVGGDNRTITANYTASPDELPSKIEWYVNGNKVDGKENSYTLIPTQAGDFTITAKVTILAPDGTTAWASDEKATPVVTYQTPTVNSVNLNTVSPYTYVGGTRTIDLDYTYSPETLPIQIEWYVDNIKETSTNRPSLTYAPTTAGEHQITAWLRILDPEKKTVWKEVSQTRTIIVYDNPASTINAQNLKTAITGPLKAIAYATQNIKFDYAVEALDSRYQWDYSWELGKQTRAGTSVSFDNPGVEGEYAATLTVQAKNPDGSGENWGNPITCKSGKTIKILNLPPPVYTELDAHTHPSSSHEYALYAGEEFDASLLYSVSGGMSTGWNARLTVDGQEQQSATFTPNRKGDYDIVLTVSNFVPDTDEPLMQVTSNYKLHVYDSPSYTTNLDATFEANSSILHVNSGDDVPFKVIVNGGEESRWEVNYCENDGTPIAFEGTGNARSHVFNSTNESDEEQVFDIEIQISNKLENQIKTSSFNESITRQIIVWKDITVTVEEPAINSNGKFILETRQGDAQKLLISLLGGDERKWTFTTTNTENITGTPSHESGQYAYNIESGELKSDGENAHTYTFCVKAEYKDGQTHAEKEFLIDMLVWPLPTIDHTLWLANKTGITFSGKQETAQRFKYQDFTYYEEDKLALTAIPSGGAPNGVWKYQVGDGGKKPLPTGNVISTTGTETIRFYNYMMNEDELIAEKMVLAVTTSGTIFTNPNIFIDRMPNVDRTMQSDWEKAEIRTDNDELIPVDLYGDGSQTASFDFSPATGCEGNPNGWSYTWKRNGEVLSTNANTWNFTAETSTNEAYEDIILSVEIKNECPETNCQRGNNVGLSITKSYMVRVWHKAILPTAIYMTDMQNSGNDMNVSHAIRKGNTMKVAVTPISYGYAPNGTENYQYIWTGINQGTSATMWSTEAVNDQDTDVFGSDTHSYGLTVRNVGPRGTYWEEKDMGEYIVNVYNRPQTPLSLVKKGDGTSGTMIVTTSTSDVNLEMHDYYLVFGYTDENGETKFEAQKQIGNGQVRWTSHYQNQAEMSSAFVYAAWMDKESQVLVTSGRRYLNDVNEDWDDSDYGYTSRDNTTRLIIGSETTPVDDIADEANALKNIQVYDANGVFVGTNTRGIASGMYIIRYLQDGVAKSKKISVK